MCTALKKWAAVISVDPVSPGGLARHWFPYGRGKVRYVVLPGLQPGMVIEFAADKIGYSGHRIEVRWYGYLLEATDSWLLLQPCKDAMDAILRARFLSHARVNSCSWMVLSADADHVRRGQGLYQEKAC